MPGTTLETCCTCCTFCTKPAQEVSKVIAGPGVFICNECVALCHDILATEGSGSNSTMNPDALSDQEILDMLPKIATVADQVEQGLNDWVRRLRGRGVTWARIGAALGMARQSAWERFSGEE